MKRSENNSRKHFLVVSTTGIGDTLMGTPALRALRESFPESRIHLLVNSRRKDLVAGNPHVDRILEYRNNSLFRALLFFKVLPFYYDTVLVFHANEDIWNVLRLIRYGVCYNRQNFRREERRVFPLNSLPGHSILKRMALVEKAGGKPSTDYRYEYSVSPGEMKWATQQLAKGGISPQDRLVGIQLGAADSFKRWAVESFAEVARYLKARHGVKIYLNASPEETGLVNKFLSLFGRDGVFQIPRKSISQSGALIQRCSLFITPDTGPMHMAVGLKVPLLGLFCPTGVEATGPLDYPPAVMIQKTVPCNPCLVRDCRENFCMSRISVEEVCEAADRMLETGSGR
jgi:ADP-heptose:LPS heptosyltransferase